MVAEITALASNLIMSYIICSGQQIRDILAKVDENKDNDISIDELESFMHAAIDKLGVPGSPWKIYVDPAQSVMTYHNVITDEKVGTL